MHTGMLWFDNKPGKMLEQMVKEAANYYNKKFGCYPDLCLMNPNSFAGQPIPVDEIKINDHASVLVRPYKYILISHLWIGVSDPFEKVPAVAAQGEQHEHI